MIRIALNMIMGKGDGPIARRFFESFDMRKLFDEIVLVTTDEKDEDVRAVINQYADKTGNFKWEDKDHPYGDFGGARNMALQLTNSEYIMWLDSDDVIPIEGIEICFMKIREVVAANLDRDYFVAPYVLTINKDNPEANYNLGIIELKKGNKAKAKQILNSVIKRFPENIVAGLAKTSLQKL